MKYTEGYTDSTRTGLKNFGAEPQKQVILMSLWKKKNKRTDTTPHCEENVLI